MDERKHVHLVAKRLGKIFFGFRFLTRVPMGNYVQV